MPPLESLLVLSTASLAGIGLVGGFAAWGWAGWLRLRAHEIARSRADDLPALAEATAGADGLRLAGVMAVAPLGVEPARAFAQLAEVAARLRSDHPQAREISAGMSGDLEDAIAAGATYVRVGTALLGLRPPPSR